MLLTLQPFHWMTQLHVDAKVETQACIASACEPRALSILLLPHLTLAIAGSKHASADVGETGEGGGLGTRPGAKGGGGSGVNPGERGGVEGGGGVGGVGGRGGSIGGVGGDGGITQPPWPDLTSHAVAPGE